MRGFTAADVPDQSGRTFFVTGANSGLGFETTRELARKGARVLMGCRSPERAQSARDRLLAELPSADLELVALDLADLDSVRAAAEVVRAEPVLHTLVNNAGIMMLPLERTAQGFESQLGTNHLGPFLLTALLLDRLEASGSGRVVHTSSNAHWFGQIHFDDLNAERSYSRFGRYAQSKLANLVHSHTLHRRLQAKGSSVRSIAVHPGGSDTELFRHFPGWLVAPSRLLSKPFLNSAASGAWPTLLAATHPDAESGGYYGPRFLELSGPARDAACSSRSRDEALGDRLFAVSIELTGAPEHP
ncbi:MAG: SDR family NAD(P)-dependent oxidoreductase [Alphaproteobacteria bacterium]|nr:SDR family NAD(P)-dependent oxidoreductase [Alphaproteobacteria bacterium]